MGGVSFWMGTGEIIIFPRKFSQAFPDNHAPSYRVLKLTVYKGIHDNWTSQECLIHQIRGIDAGTSNSLINQLEWFSSWLSGFQDNGQPFLYVIKRGWVTTFHEHWKGDSYADWVFDEVTSKDSTNINILQKRFESGKVSCFLSAIWIVFTSPLYSLGEWILNSYQLLLSALWESPITSFSFLHGWIIDSEKNCFSPVHYSKTQVS